MEKTIETIIKHPIATTIVIGCFMRGIASIVAAARGNDIQPVVTINQLGKAANNVKEVVNNG